LEKGTSTIKIKKLENSIAANFNLGNVKFRVRLHKLKKENTRQIR